MSDQRRYLLAYGALHTAGIETLIVRLANHLARDGGDVAVCFSGGALASALDGRVAQLDYAGPTDAVRRSCEWLSTDPKAPPVLISFDPISAALGLAIETGVPADRDITHLSGVYHPRAYHMNSERRDRVWLNRLVARAVGDSHLFYMNRESRDDHAARWGVDLSRSAIIPVPVDAMPRVWTPRSGASLKVVSVGRLTDFKQYNLGIPGIIRDCHAAGVEIDWDIYGTGPLADEMIAEITRCGVADHVTMKGSLAYHQMSETVARYDLFVGLGTAALEAAMQGVPTIAATDSQQRASYGYFHQLPFGNLGERQATPAPCDIGDMLIDHARLDESARIDLSEQAHAAAMLYAMPDIALMLHRLAEKAPPPPSRSFKRAVAELYRTLTDSRLVKLLRRAKHQTPNRSP